MSAEKLLERLYSKVVSMEKKLSAMEQQAQKATWVTSQDLSRLAGGLTKEQLRTIRENYSDWVKPKDDQRQSYLYNWTELQHIYPSQKAAA